MKLFWPVYSSSLIIGTAIVYILAPFCRPYVAPFLGKEAPGRQSTPAEEDSHHVSDLSPQIFEPAPAPSVDAAIPEEERPSASPAASAAQTEDTDAPPALQGIYLASYGSKPEWGITWQPTSYYKTNGTRIGQLPGGTVFTYRETLSSSKGVMVKSQLLSSGPTNDVYLIGKKDVYLFTGHYSSLTPRQRTHLTAYYALNGKIALRKNELLQASAAKNPYFSAYHAAYQAYMGHIEKAKAIGEQRDRAMNLERSQFEDKLREMKIQEMRLKTDYETAHKKFRSWKDQHADEQTKPENDPSIRNWSKEMAALRNSIPGLAM